jgi:hypothetical protein
MDSRGNVVVILFFVLFILFVGCIIIAVAVVLVCQLQQLTLESSYTHLHIWPESTPSVPAATIL